ncbi:MAG: AAA family ATPase [Spirochaetota bacterium]|nr:AAA family ATPase [Spirochaetota bacterium]HPV98880.1 AAA family ATPase [Spirochaetota bacterium]
MKIAVTGKGGVGKSTVAAALALMMAENGGKVLALDADPDSNLAAALGMSAAERSRILSIARQRELIGERTGTKPGSYGQVFRLNPDVSDVAERFGIRHRGVFLIVLGAIRSGGSGCACPESAFLGSLVGELVLRRDETVIMDMEAGVEHLGRATARGVDVMLVVVEPGARAAESARRIVAMAREIGVTNVRFVFNRVRSQRDEEYLRNELGGKDVLGVLPFAESLLDADRDGTAVLDAMDDEFKNKIAGIIGSLGLMKAGRL